MGLKLKFFILEHLMVSDDRRHSNKIKTKKNTKICYINQKIELLQSHNLLLKIALIQISLHYISGLNQDIVVIFSVLSLFQVTLLAEAIECLKI